MVNIQEGTISRCHNYLDSIGKINQQSVQNVPHEVKIFLRNVTPKRLSELAKLNCFAADKVKTKLDKKYGANNYIVVAIGRSLSSIVKLIGEMGANTKNFPLSGLRRRDIDDISTQNRIIYKSFLAQIGLSKTDLEANKDKTYILMDYTYYGRSLNRTEKFLKRDDMLGNTDNLISIPVSEVLGEDYKKLGFNRLFEYSRFKDYSSVGKLHVDKLNDVYNQCSPERVKEFQGNITQGLRKLFWFNVFDSINNQNYKDIFPQKEINALYKHYMSPKAIRNFISREQKKIIDYTKNPK